MKEITVYISDKSCRDGYNFSFKEYCDKICEEMFVTFHTQPKNEKILLRDAVAFSLYDGGFWIDLSKVIEAPSLSPNATLDAAIEKFSNPSFHADDNDESGEIENDDQRVNDDEAQKIILENSDKENYGSSSFGVAHTFSPENPLVAIHQDDFASIPVLQQKVFSILTARASSIVYYTQSRFTRVSAASAINSFPSALQLIYYVGSIFLLFFFTLVIVKTDSNLAKIAAGCSASPSSGSSTSSSTTNAPSSSSEDYSSSLHAVIFYLLGFRLLNSSAFGTATLVLVKTLRALYQRAGFQNADSNLTLQQRLPLMALYSDRKIQAMLGFYFLLIFPFSFSGLFYGLFRVSWVCIIPLFVGILFLILNGFALGLMRKLSSVVVINKHHHLHHDTDGLLDPENTNNLQDTLLDDKNNNKDEKSIFYTEVHENSNTTSKRNFGETPINHQQQQHQINVNSELQADVDSDDDDEPARPVASSSSSSKRKNHNSDEDSDEEAVKVAGSSSGKSGSATHSRTASVTNNSGLKQQSTTKDSSSSSPSRKSSVTNLHQQHQQEEVEQTFKKNKNESFTDRSATLGNFFASASLADHGPFQEAKLEQEVRTQQSSIMSATPISLGKALLVFLLTEELPTMILAMAFQTSFNYTALLYFQQDFALSNDHLSVVSKDFHSRSVHCELEFFKYDVSAKLSDLSSLVPFM